MWYSRGVTNVYNTYINVDNNIYCERTCIIYVED